MERKDVLFIGVGQAGSNVVSEILKQNSRYVGLFINTSYTDLLSIENAKNVYTIPSADGTGRNRNKAKLFVKDYRHTLLDEINKFKGSNVLYFVFSFGGGSGSGISPVLIKMLEVTKSNKIINVVGILPSYEESKRVKQNAIECWNELIQQKNINAFYLLDNNKRKDKMEINKEFAQQFDMFMNISQPHPNGVIDKEEIGILANAKGSTALYVLPNDESDTKIAIAKAINNSIFADFGDYNEPCKYLGISTVEDKFNQRIIESEFEYNEDCFKGFNSSANIVITSGCKPQKIAIEMLGISIKEKLNKKISSIDEFEDLTVEGVITDNDKMRMNEIVNNHTKNIKQEATDVDKILDDDSLWDSIFS